MYILGLHPASRLADEDEPVGFSQHNAAAALIRDGEIVAAIEEERLDRLKHSNCYPVQSIRYCLSEAGIKVEDLTSIALDYGERWASLAAQGAALDDPSLPVAITGRQFVAGHFRRVFGADVSEKLHFCGHHLAHAWSAYAPSGFGSSLILVLDGDGDARSGGVYLGSGSTIESLREFTIRNSLGQLYQSIIKLVGYRRFDEYKVMGLAPYGSSETYSALFSQCYKLLPDGAFELDPLRNWFERCEAAGLMDRARRRGQRMDQVHLDIAAALQDVVEQVAVHVLEHYRRETGQDHLCIAGGVAHNCAMNGKIARTGLFEDIFIQPAAHDAGCALGAAWHAWIQQNGACRLKRQTHVYYGEHIGSADAIRTQLERWADLITIEEPESITDRTASLLAQGAVVAWVQGRSEFGPRALGNRSILADPRPESNRLRINRMIKKREEFRPFAPSVVADRAHEFFDLPRAAPELPFMIMVVPVCEHERKNLGAITHVDGSARVHTVSKADNFRYWNLLQAFDRLTGYPILLNTSLNNNAEPIVDGIDDAVSCYLTTGLDYLVVGNFLVERRSPDIAQYCSHLEVVLPSHKKLVQRTDLCGVSRFEIASTRSDYFGVGGRSLSEPLFRLLSNGCRKRTLAYAAHAAGLPDDALPELCRELADLWGERLVHLRPIKTS